MNSQNIINLGAKVKHLRTRLNFSIRQLAEKSEVSSGYISQIENGKTNPSVTTLYAIATALNVSIQSFFDDDDILGTGTSATEFDKVVSQFSQNPEVQNLTEPLPISVNHVAQDNRATIKLDGGVSWARLTSRSYDHIEFLELNYEPGSESGKTFSRHIGREFGLVLEGTLHLYLGFEEYELQVGDSILFNSSTPHKLKNMGDKPMRALWVAFNLNT